MGIEITGVWLRHEGRDPGIAVVLIAVGGKWVEVIRELDSGPYSVVVSTADMLNAPEAARAGQGADRWMTTLAAERDAKAGWDAAWRAEAAEAGQGEG